MASLILRLIKGSPLTNAEVDGNFSALNTELATKITASSADTLTNKVLDDISNEIGANHLHFKVKATQNLVAGDVVKVTGFNAGENAYEVAKMTATTDVAVGIIDGTIAIGGLGAVVNTGLLEGFDTSAFTVGQILYPNGTGGLTATQPSSGTYQAIAFVLRSHAINGAALVEASEPAAVRTSSNTGNTVVLRDASGNFSAGTITAALSGNATTATSAGKWTTARTLSFTGDATGSGSVDGSANVATALTLANSGVTAGVYGSSTAIPSLTIDAKGRVTSASTNSISVGNGTLTLAVSGTGLSGSQTFTANQGTNATFTVTSNATSANTASTIVARDASGNFTAGTITAALSGNAATATALQTARTINGVSFDGTANITITAAANGGNADTVDSLHASDFMRTRGTTNSNIDSDWGEGVVTFDPIPTGTPPISSPNIRVLNLGNDYNRRTQVAFNYSTDQTWFRRKHDASWGSWREYLHSGNYNSYALPLSGGTVNGTVRINSQLQVGQNTNGTAIIDAYGGYAYFGRDSNSLGVRISDGGYTRIQTASGYLDVGPLNSSWCHFQTDRSRFYMGTSLSVDGDIQRYSDSAIYLHTANYTSYAATASHVHDRIYNGASSSGAYLLLSSGNELEYFSSSGVLSDLYIQYSGSQTSLRGPGGAVILNSTNWSSYVSTGMPTSGGTFTGVVSAPAFKTTGAYGSQAQLGSISASWGGQAYPTLYSDTADRWVMHINPHISYVQNGVNGYTGGTFGAMIRFASNTAAATYWDAGVLSLIGSDTWGVARAGSWRMYVDSGANFYAAGNIQANSDERLKKDWVNVAADFVEQIATAKSGTYTRTDSGVRQAGSSAQDWEKILPEVVSAGTDGTLALAYGNAALVSAVELAKRVVAQEARIKRLEQLIDKFVG